ncbi:helix-turn-helix domain-containing protein [Erysipelotrichaceae bacterium OttesenSCG-928-M19]|nr:helix-turn-helix domain-containing protein [Erysipelotrichaceae bacterium OttesenSCG-928-M19]
MFSVKDFVNLKEINTANVLTCINILNQYPIEYIAVIETPVDNFVRKNELVLTTAKGCDTDTTLFNYLNDIYNSEAAAAVIARPNNDLMLSKKTITYFEERKFPIIIIPWEIRFSDLLEIVFKKIRDNTLLEINFYEEIQSTLLKSYLNNEDLLQATNILSQNFKCDVAILDINFELRGYSNPKFLNYYNWPALNLISIDSNEQNYGYIFFLLNDDSHHYNSSLIQRYIINCLTLWFDREWMIYATHQNAKDNFVTKLTQENLKSSKSLDSHALLLGFNLNLPYTCLVGKLINTNIEKHVNLDDWIYDKWLSVQELIINTARKIHLKVMFTYHDNVLIIYLENSKINSEQKITAFLNDFESFFKVNYPDVLFSWGISNINDDLYTFKDKYENAKLAQKLCENNKGQITRFTYESTITYHLINSLYQNENVSDDLYNLIAPLVDYDSSYGLELMKTLKIYLQTRNASQTAQQLHLHRQSLLYRLNKIEQLIKLSLKDYNNIFLLEMALRLHYDYLDKEMAS